MSTSDPLPSPLPSAARSRIRLSLAGTAIAVFDVGGALYAIEDACLRCGSPLVAGSLVDTVVTCPGCGWRYDLGSGCVVGLPALRLPIYPVSTS
jgi:3-phenylpropionate/trans-cinnamate dioxygenase ferredoxin subunit